VSVVEERVLACLTCMLAVLDMGCPIRSARQQSGPLHVAAYCSIALISALTWLLVLGAHASSGPLPCSQAVVQDTAAMLCIGRNSITYGSTCISWSVTVTVTLSWSQKHMHGAWCTAGAATSQALGLQAADMLVWQALQMAIVATSSHRPSAPAVGCSSGT
jgi:hypothetical protein